jgi:hypothetical protein
MIRVVLSRRATIALVVIVLLVLGLFLLGGALDPPSRLRSRPATATPRGVQPVATAVKP